MDDERLIQNERFSGQDWALEEVERVRYEDCAFHDVDWSEARLTGCTFSYCEFGNVRFNAAVLQRCAILQSVLGGDEDSAGFIRQGIKQKVQQYLPGQKEG